MLTSFPTKKCKKENDLQLEVLTVTMSPNSRKKNINFWGPNTRLHWKRRFDSWSCGGFVGLGIGEEKCKEPYFFGSNVGYWGPRLKAQRKAAGTISWQNFKKYLRKWHLETLLEASLFQCGARSFFHQANTSLIQEFWGERRLDELAWVYLLRCWSMKPNGQKGPISQKCRSVVESLILSEVID